jgi:hypothetical protein
MLMARVNPPLPSRLAREQAFMSGSAAQPVEDAIAALLSSPVALKLIFQVGNLLLSGTGRVNVVSEAGHPCHGIKQSISATC